jgi:hypothetical protein
MILKHVLKVIDADSNDILIALIFKDKNGCYIEITRPII